MQRRQLNYLAILGVLILTSLLILFWQATSTNTGGMCSEKKNYSTCSL